MTPFEKIIKRYPQISDIPYSELLRTKEWLEKRSRILHRDSEKCTCCGKSGTSTYYDSESKSAMHIWYGEEKPVFLQGPDGTRKEIDRYVPMVLSEKPYSMQVHHKFYVLDRLPWCYDDQDLILLCNWCHWEFHLNNIVPVYRDQDNLLVVVDVVPCYRCHGTGSFPEYSHIEGGICFRCRGARFEVLDK